MKKMKNTPLIGLIAALSLIFASCDNKNELPDNELSGEEVPVRIRSMSIDEEDSESLTRSSLQKEPEIVTTPISDGMLLEMSVKEDESPLRDAVLLGEGKLFRVIAVEHGSNKYYSHGDFAVGADGPSNDFLVRIGEKYDYICISLNSDTDLPPDDDYEVGEDLDDEFTVDNSKDLLWCRIDKAENVPASGVDLDILLKQKLAKVTVVVDCDYNKWKIGVTANKVAIVAIDPNCTIDWKTGAITGTDIDRLFTSFTTTPNATSQTSNEARFIPTSSNATIKFLVSAISRNGYATDIPSDITSIEFSTALSAGVSYTILIRLRTPIWARSNIYWMDTGSNTGYLTFVPAADDPADNDNTKQGYQGVFFKFGSLVGISPTVLSYDDNTAIYVPYDYPANPRWKKTTRDAVKEDTDIPTATDNWTSWGSGTANATDIPYLDPSYIYSPSGWDNAFAMDAAYNNTATYQGLRGDICQYIGAMAGSTEEGEKMKNYRLPTTNEFGYSAASWENSATRSSPGSTMDDGTTNLIGASADQSCFKNTTMEDVIFPLAGIRVSPGGMSNAGQIGHYWGGSSYGSDQGVGMLFRGYDSFKDIMIHPRDMAKPVRCVKN
jgi:hypothetical protein